jgi:hypothetical protein
VFGFVLRNRSEALEGRMPLTEEGVQAIWQALQVLDGAKQ